MKITADLIRGAYTGIKHDNYMLTVALSERLRVHASGRMPELLINRRRPSEPEEVKEYRRMIYVSKTKNPIFKVFNSLEKIRRSQDWNIQHEREINARITPEESLEHYTEKDYPVFDSVTNWLFSIVLQEYLLDSNSVVLVHPGASDDPAKYNRPFAEIFNSAQVIDYVDGEYCILKSYDCSTYKTPSGKTTKTDGEVYYIVTDEQYARIEQTGGRKTFDVVELVDHNIGKLPAFRCGGIFHARKRNATIYESRIASMVPSLDEAAREYSDLQAEIVQHIYSERYAYVNTECPECHGSGVNENREKCTKCEGSGSILKSSNYNTYVINPAKALESQLPTPPIGYITKSTDIAKLQDDRVRQHIYDALSTLNMEFLAEKPLNQSGTAKEVDRDELNNFVNSIAEDIVRIADKVYYFINELRYSTVLPDKEAREAQLPVINTPTRYDIISSSMLFNEFKAAKDAGASAATQAALECEYLRKKFNADPETIHVSELEIELDPLYGHTEDEKTVILGNGGATLVDYIISSNISNFIRRAMRENKEWDGGTPEQQRATLESYAQDVIKANNAAKLAV